MDPRESSGEYYEARKVYPGGAYEGQFRMGTRNGKGQYVWDDG